MEIFLLASPELDMEKIIGGLLTILIGMIIYWRKTKDKTDEKLQSEIDSLRKESKKTESGFYEKINENQQKLMCKMNDVLTSQHSIDVKITKAFGILEQHSKKLEELSSNQNDSLKKIEELRRSEAIMSEWKKRIEDKLEMK